LIPETNHGLLKILVIPKHTDPRRLQQQRFSDIHSQPAPPRPQDSQKMAVSKDNGPAFIRCKIRNHRIRSGDNLLNSFSAGAPMTEDIPAGEDLLNLSLSLSFKVPVVPFNQSGILLSTFFETSQTTGSLRTLKRTHQNTIKFDSSQPS